jgi:hypothetical protein
VGAINAMYERHREKADFRVVYVREAHPADGWQVPKNRVDGVVFNEPKTLEERIKVARECAVGLALKLPIVIDGMDDAVEKAYAGWPDRIYIVDAQGKIAYKGAPGPAGFRPAEAEAALRRLLR